MTAISDAITKVREEFATNHLYGWYSWLKEYHDALNQSDFALCDTYLAEIDNGYALWPEEVARLIELRDVRLFHREGRNGFFLYYQDRQNATGHLNTAEASQINLRMGMIHQYRGAVSQQASSLATARTDYGKCLAYWQTNANQRAIKFVEDLLKTLEEQEGNGQLGDFFLHHWEACTDGKIDPLQETKDLASEILIGEDWQRGRIALAAMECLQENDVIAIGLNSPVEQTAIAAIATLRKQRVQQVETHLISALQSTYWIVRWQAAIALGQLGSRAADHLVERLQAPEDILVRIAAANALGKVGRPADIPRLHDVAAHANTDVDIDVTIEENNERSLRAVANNAIAQIEKRFPPSPPPVIGSVNTYPTIGHSSGSSLPPQRTYPPPPKQPDHKMYRRSSWASLKTGIVSYVILAIITNSFPKEAAKPETAPIWLQILLYIVEFIMFSAFLSLLIKLIGWCIAAINYRIKK